MRATRTRRRDRMNAEVTLIKTAAETALADAFARRRTSLPGGRQVVARREAAFRRFERVGLPHRRIEDWKYTDLRVLMREVLPLAPAPDAAALSHAAAALRLHAIDGVRRL